MITFAAFRGGQVAREGTGSSSLVSADCWLIVNEQRAAEFEVNISSLDRLEDALTECSGSLQVGVRGVLEDGKAFLHFEVRGSLQLVCQRCLEPVAWPVEINSVLRVVKDESGFAQAENDAEFSVDDLEDVIVVGSEVTLERLIEDELLLGMPISAVHDSCTSKIEHGNVGANSPFAGLREKLKNQSKE